MVLDLSPSKWYSIHMNEKLIPRVGDLVKMKIDIELDRGVAGVIHGVRKVAPHYANDHADGLLFDITWPDVRSVQYLSEIRVVSRS